MYDGEEGKIRDWNASLPASPGANVNAPGFQRDGNAYVNSAYGKSPVTLTLDIQGGIGTINLESGS